MIIWFRHALQDMQGCLPRHKDYPTRVLAALENMRTQEGYFHDLVDKYNAIPQTPIYKNSVLRAIRDMRYILTGIEGGPPMAYSNGYKYGMVLVEVVDFTIDTEDCA